MTVEPLLAGIHDTRATLAPARARELVTAALEFHGPVRIAQSGPLTVGLAGSATSQPVPPGVLCALEGRPRLAGRWIGEAALAGAWAESGDGVLPTLRGTFLAALWDEQRHQGLIARDQLGQRPLLWHSGERLTFAGEFKPLLALLNPTPAPDPEIVACWLGSRMPASGRTLYAGVRRLEPGHMIELRPDGWSPRPYWRPVYQEPFDAPDAELIDELRTQMGRATATVLDGSRSPGLLLSGGVDSSSVAAVAAGHMRETGGSLRAYSAGFPGLPQADESPLVDELCQALELSGTRMEVFGGSLVAGLARYAATWRMPDLSANNFFWVDLLERAAAEGVDVLLDGEGGDELFHTPYYVLADRLRAGRIRETRELLERWPMIAGNPSRRLRAHILGSYAVGGMLPRFVDAAVARVRPPMSPIELLPHARRAAQRASDPASWKRLDGPRWWAQLTDMAVHGPDVLGGPEHALRLGRLAGVPRGRPLLDLDLTEFVLRLPPELSFRPEYGKAHLREAMAGQVPDAVRLRRQKTFFTDVRMRSLVESSDLAFARRLLGPGAEVRRYVTEACVEEAVSTPDVTAPHSSRAIWGFRLQHLCGTEIWLRSLADPAFAAGLAEREGLEPAHYSFVGQGPAR